jgi:hypothetical protein
VWVGPSEAVVGEVQRLKVIATSPVRGIRRRIAGQFELKAVRLPDTGQ